MRLRAISDVILTNTADGRMLNFKTNNRFFVFHLGSFCSFSKNIDEFSRFCSGGVVITVFISNRSMFSLDECSVEHSFTKQGRKFVSS